jgi:hypothetical protein
MPSRGSQAEVDAGVVAEERRAKWMRFVAQRENDAVAKFASDRGIVVREPPHRDDWSGKSSAKEMYIMMAVVDQLVVLSTPNTTEKNHGRLAKFEKQRKADLSALTTQIKSLPQKVDQGKGFFWTNYPAGQGVALVPSTKLRVHPKRLASQQEIEAANDKKSQIAAWTPYQECTIDNIINSTN